jgi:predicted nucleotidyltransferase
MSPVPHEKTPPESASPVKPRSPDAPAREKIDTMVRRIVERFQPDRIILFGSHARGTAGPDSDVDLLVVLRDPAPKRQKVVEIYRLLAGIGLPKDVIIVSPEEVERYRSVPGTIIRPALLEGKVLYERSA